MKARITPTIIERRIGLIKKKVKIANEVIITLVPIFLKNMNIDII